MLPWSLWDVTLLDVRSGGGGQDLDLRDKVTRKISASRSPGSGIKNLAMVPKWGKTKLKSEVLFSSSLLLHGGRGEGPPACLSGPHGVPLESYL